MLSSVLYSTRRHFSTQNYIRDLLKINDWLIVIDYINNINLIYDIIIMIIDYRGSKKIKVDLILLLSILHLIYI